MTNDAAEMEIQRAEEAAERERQDRKHLLRWHYSESRNVLNDRPEALAFIESTGGGQERLCVRFANGRHEVYVSLGWNLVKSDYETNAVEIAVRQDGERPLRTLANASADGTAVFLARKDFDLLRNTAQISFGVPRMSKTLQTFTFDLEGYSLIREKIEKLWAH